MAHLGTTLLLGFPAVSTVSTPTPPSPPSRVQSFPLARAATSRRSRAVIPTLTALALPCRSARLHRSIAPSVADATHLSNSIQHADDEPARGALGGTMGAHGRCALRIPAAHMWLLCVDVPSAETCRPGRENLHTGRVMHTAVVRFLGRDGTTAAVRAACTGMSSRAGGTTSLRWAEGAVHVVVCQRGRERRGVACGCGRAVAVGMFARPTLLRHAFLPHGPMDSPRAEDLCG